MSSHGKIRLEVPGSLLYRNLAVRVVTSACKLVPPSGDGADAHRPDDEFDAQVVSAFGEAFNNVAIHGYKGLEVGLVVVEIETGPEHICISLEDHGHTYDPAATPTPSSVLELDALDEPDEPELREPRAPRAPGADAERGGPPLGAGAVARSPSRPPGSGWNSLPENGMGLFIIRSFMDEVTYTAGPPNVLRLKKHRRAASSSTRPPAAPSAGGGEPATGASASKS